MADRLFLSSIQPELTAWVCEWGGLRVGVRHSLKSQDLCVFNVKSNDRSYWLSVRRFLNWLGEPFAGGSRWARAAYKDLRRGHHTSKAKDWEDVLAPGVARWASGEIKRQADKENCVDNFRVARLGNTGQMRRYRRQRSRGCCGSSDWEAIGPDGNVYALGFNYGH